MARLVMDAESEQQAVETLMHSLITCLDERNVEHRAREACPEEEIEHHRARAAHFKQEAAQLRGELGKRLATELNLLWQRAGDTR